MAVRDLLTYPDPRLKEVAQPVTAFDDALRRFVADLEETRLASPGASGIAAPQVGRLQQIVIVDVSARRASDNCAPPNHGHLVLVNPEITDWKGMSLGREGCLSVPDFTGKVIRAKRIDLVAYDPDGGRHEYRMSGFEARAVQHEIDHLDGVLFLDRLVSRRNDLFRRAAPEPDEDAQKLGA